ncbi:uncharacterized protein [Canis lupus baileyi]|uniref:uncharacterized protein isoform X2 n=1 Tax=Canis lupus baileyi TaxID=143281 RepID=UPI003B96AE7E
MGLQDIGVPEQGTVPGCSGGPVPSEGPGAGACPHTGAAVARPAPVTSGGCAHGEPGHLSGYPHSPARFLSAHRWQGRPRTRISVTVWVASFCAGVFNTTSPVEATSLEQPLGAGSAGRAAPTSKDRLGPAPGIFEASLGVEGPSGELTVKPGEGGGHPAACST